MERLGKIAVIIVNYNSGGYLKQCLTSLNNQTRLPDRVLVVDNASEDGSQSVISEFQPLIELIAMEENLGFAAANNLAVRKVEDCPWVVLLNPDAFPHVDWLEQLEKIAWNNPNYSFFGSHMLAHSGNDRIDGTGDVYHISGLAWRRDHGMSSKKIRRISGEVFSPCAAAALYNREVFLSVGGFDESFFTYFEDVDLGFRLRLMGERCLYVPEAKVEHVGWGTTQPKSTFSLYYGHRNLEWAFFKNMPSPLIRKYLIHHLMYMFFYLFWFGLRGQGFTYLRAKWNALLGLPAVLKQRKKIQKTKKVSPKMLDQAFEHRWLPILKKKIS